MAIGELKVIGDWFSNHVRRSPSGMPRLCGAGREGADRADIRLTPKLDTRTPFGFRAGVAQVSQPDPPPLFSNT